jgi:alanine racemase
MNVGDRDYGLSLGSGDRREQGLEPNALDVDLAAIKHNARSLRRAVGSDVSLYAALKCDAYGFGLVPVAHALVSAGVDAVAVSRMQDAIELRSHGVTVPILLYAGAEVTPAFARAVEKYELTPTVLDRRAANTLSTHLEGDRGVFVKVDVGQRRLGVEPRETRSLIEAIVDLPRLRVDGVYTHMAVPPDPAGAGYVDQEFALFEACVAELDALGLAPPVRMAASSSVLRLFDRMNLTAVDPGRSYFGTADVGPATEALELRSALRALRTRLLQNKVMDHDPRRPPPVVPVPDGMRLGVIPLGTADGLDRASAAYALVRGRRAPLIEPIALEHCRLDLTDCPDASAGDEVVLIGVQDDETISIDDVAAHRGLGGAQHRIAINVPRSVPRRYIGDGER